jgi:hypothetical protein
MERLFICFRMMKQETWLSIVAGAMKNATRIEAPDEVGRAGQFFEYLEDFVMNRHKGEQKEDILLGRPWEDQEGKRHYFRLKDLMKFLEIAGFKIYNRGQVTSRLRMIKGDKHFFSIQGKGVNVWYIPSTFTPTPTPDTPELSREPI